MKTAIFALFCLTLPAVDTATPIALYSLCNPVLRSIQCGRNAECVGVPGCSMGNCRCRDVARDGQRFFANANGIDCDSILKLGASCTPTDANTNQLPPRAECSAAGVVVCEAGFEAKGSYECTAPASWIQTLNANCSLNQPNDCNVLLGLSCVQGRCACLRGSTWSGRRCEPSLERECRSHEDCAFVYGETAVCLHNRRCVCGAGSTPVAYAQLSSAENQRKFYVSNYCAAERSPLGSLDANCTVPGFPSGAQAFCQQGLVCHHCPEHGTSPEFGKCLNLTSSQYNSVRTKVFRSGTIEGVCSSDNIRPR